MTQPGTAQPGGTSVTFPPVPASTALDAAVNADGTITSLPADTAVTVHRAHNT